MLLPGRAVHGEAHVYDRYWAETEVRRPEGTLLFPDVLRLNPADEDPRSIARLRTHGVVVTLYVVATESDSLAAPLRSALAACPDVLAGVSTLPNHCGGVAGRLLGPTSKSLRATMGAAWSAARLALLGAPPPNRRKGEIDPAHNPPHQGAA